MKYTPIPKRSDKSINFDAYRNIHEQTRKFIGTKFDPTYFHTIEDPTGIYVTLNGDSASGSEFNHHYKTTAASATTYDINLGYWRRNGVVSDYAGEEVDPITAGIIDTSFEGDIYNYVVRANSSGTTDALTVFTTENPIVDDEANRSFTHMEELISVVTYKVNTETGLNYIESISQNLVGSIDDKYEMGSDFENFGLNIETAIDALVTITVGAGDLKRRDYGITSIGGNSSTVDALPVCVYLRLGDEYTAPDASLIPYEPAVVIANAFPADLDYAHLFFKLYYITNNKVTNGAGIEYNWVSVRRFHVGAVYDDWVRPDGQDSGIPDVDAGVPNGRTLDFVGSGEHEGELQDYYFKEHVVDDGLGYFSTAGDQVIPWYEWSDTTTEKTYARLDAVNNSVHSCGQSFWIDGGRAELYKFLAGNDAAVTDVTTQSPDPFRFLVRVAGGADLPELKYADLSQMKVYDSYNADYADEAGSVGSGVIDEIIDQILPHNHEEHNFNFDDHSNEGIDRYIINNGDSTRNNMSGTIGDSGGLLSIAPDSRDLTSSTGNISVDWSGCYLYDANNANLAVDWISRVLSDGTNDTLDWNARELKHDHWTVKDTEAAGDGAGCLRLDGGIYGARGAYFKKGTAVWAGQFFESASMGVQIASATVAMQGGDTGGRIFSFADGTQAGYFTDGTRTISIADGSYALVSTGGGASFDYTSVGLYAHLAGYSASAGSFGNTNTSCYVTLCEYSSGYSIEASGGNVSVTSGVFECDTLPGLTQDGHTGGILTDAGAMAASQDTAVQDLMIGYTLL